MVRCCALEFAFILSISGLFGASGYYGQVTFKGVPVPGASVTARRGGEKLVTITDATGHYAFPSLTEGAWLVEVEMLGFATMRGDTSTTRWELKMLPISELRGAIPGQAGARPDTAIITVNADASVGEHAPSPEAGLQLIQLNASQGATFKSSLPNGGSGSGSLANVQEDVDERALEGLLFSGGLVKKSGSIPPARAPDSNLSAVLAQPLYHGGFGFLPNTSWLDARSYSLTGQNTPKPDSARSSVSFNFGGPVFPQKKNASFFIAYDRTRSRSANTLAGRMPTKEERSGDLSQLHGNSGNWQAVIDPQSGAPFPANQIPESRVSSQAKSLLSLFPFPNFIGDAPYNYQIPLVDAAHQDALRTRWNEVIEAQHQISGHFDTLSTRSEAPNLFNFVDRTGASALDAEINWRIRPSWHFVTTLRYQFNGLASNETPYFSNRIDISGAAGITGNSQNPVDWGPPALVFAGGTSSLSDAQYSITRNRMHTFSYDAFWNRGRHNVAFGGDFRRQQTNLLSQQNPRGTLTFTGAQTGSDVAEFLIGLPDVSSIAFGNADKYFRQPFYDLFLTDEWKMADMLTVVLGTRWEYESPIRELYGRLVNLRISQGFSVVQPVVGNHLIQADKRGLQPRVAVAWRPTARSSFVLRAGYGVYRNTDAYRSIAYQMAQQPPLSKNLSIDTAVTHRLTLANPFSSALTSTLSTFAIDPTFRIGYAQVWTLSLQRDLPGAIQLSGMYLGTKGTRLPQESLPNTFPSGALNPAGYVYLSSNGSSIREAGEIQLRRRLQGGLAATVQYTFSKGIDDAPLMAGDQIVGASTIGTPIAQNWLNLAAERALSNFDQRHQLTIQGQYSTGVGGRGGALLHGWRAATLTGWTTALSMRVGTGLPQTAVYFAAVRSTGVTGSLRPDATGASVRDTPTGLFLNPAAFRAPRPGYWGNTGRNTITGPSQFSLDASLGRSFRWAAVEVDLRLDITNALNQVTFTGWNTVVESTQFGLPTGVNSMRRVQPILRVRF